MDIIETNIPDITEDADSTKVMLADQILARVKPLFSQAETEKHKGLQTESDRLTLIKQELKKNRLALESYMERYQKEKKIKQILNKISTLVSSGLAYDGSLKNETVILLRVLTKLPMFKLDEQLTQVTNTLNKRF